MMGDMRRTRNALPTVLAGALALVVGYLALGVLLWCWEGAYNVLQGGPPDWMFATTLVLAGMAPLVTAWFGFRVPRRHGESLASSLAFASLATLAVTVFVGFFRAGASGGF
jgi:hypothetical protein